MKRLVFAIAILVTVTAKAQNVTLKAKAPAVVRLNERFQVVYEANQKGNNFKSGNLNEFNVLSGPSMGSSTSMSIVNGQISHSTTVSYTYLLSAKKTGKFTISPGSLSVDGKEYASNSVTIEVVEGNASQGTQQSTVQEISEKDLFIKLETNKSIAWKGEPVVASIKLYSRVQLRELRNLEIPQFDGFWREDIALKNKNIEWKRENVNGEIYNSAIISQFVLTPQKAGKQRIEPIEMEVVALQEVEQKRNTNRFNDPFFDDSFFDNFFNQRGYQPVMLKLKSPALTLNIKDLPYSADLTGDFKITSDISKTEVNANESITLKVVIAGKGNLKMAEPLSIPFPPDFETFDPESSQNITVSTSGISGTKTFEYLFIPRHAGTYNIPSVTLKAFNPVTGKVEELKTSEYKITVKKGKPGVGISGTDYSKKQQDIRFLGKDIRHIKTNDFPLVKDAGVWFGSISFYLTYCLAGGLFMVVFLFMRKQRQEREDEVSYKKRKAGTIARKRLKIAEKLLKEQNTSEFYKELLHGIWGYVGDKLNLQKSSLSKDRIREELSKRNVSPEAVQSLFSVIEKCERAQYAPAGNTSTLEEDYEETVKVISDLEEEIKS